MYIELKRTNILLSYYNLFLLYWFMYTVGIYLSGVEINDTINFATYLIILAGVFFVIGYNIIPLNNKSFIQEDISTKTFIPPNILPILLLITTVAIGFFVYVVVFKIGLSEYFFSSRAYRSWIVRPYSPFMIFIDLFNFTSTLSLFLYLNSKRKAYLFIFIIVFATALVHAVLTISRNNLILLLLPTIYLFHYYNYIKTKWLIVIFLVGIFIAIIWKVLLFYLIMSNSFSISSIMENIKFPREFVVWQEIAQNVLKDNISLHGQSYIDAIIKLLWPFSHTDNLSLWYVQTYEPDTFAKGGGRGFSNILEAYINFNTAGVIIFFFLFGVFIYKFQKKSMESIYLFLPYAFSLAFVNRIFRSDFTSLTKTWWWMYFISFLLLFSLFKEKKEQT